MPTLRRMSFTEISPNALQKQQDSKRRSYFMTGLPLLKSGLGENTAEGAMWPVRCELSNSSGHSRMKIQCVAFHYPKKEKS